MEPGEIAIIQNQEARCVKRTGIGSSSYQSMMATLQGLRSDLFSQMSASKCEVARDQSLQAKPQMGQE